MITKDEIFSAQKKWANSLVEIGSLKENRENCEERTSEILKDLYAFESGDVLFKPTKASQVQFRKNFTAAKSYFIGGDEKYPEDKGFALEPWQDIRFENTWVVTDNNRALAMGNYYFKAPEKDEVKVEYTFSYVKNDEGDLKIDLHHSSLPYH